MIWEVSVSRMGLSILGTAPADHMAMIWGTEVDSESRNKIHPTSISVV